MGDNDKTVVTPSVWPADQALWLAWLAEARLAQGEVEKAAAVGLHALDRAQTAGSARVLRALAPTAQALRRRRRLEPVDHFIVPHRHTAGARKDRHVDFISTATSADEARRRSDVAVLPIGSFEQHGAILPLATDTIVASAIARAVAEEYGLLLLPPVTISCSHEHAAWAGTVSLSHRTLTAIIDDVRASLRQSGINRLVLVNGHGGNYVLSNVVQEANIPAPAMTLFPTRDDWHTARTAAGLISTSHEDMHGGELEVSILRHVSPHLVADNAGDADHFSTERRFLLVQGMRGFTESGVIGRPSLGTAEKGKALLASLVSSFGHHLVALRHQP